MAVTQYTGSRYVPLFADPAEWSAANAYEALTIVLHEGNSFTSKQPVPVGIEIDNEAYWAETGNYNAQVEQYRQEVRTFDSRITANANRIESVNDALTESIEDVNETLSNKIAEVAKTPIYQAREYGVIGDGVTDNANTMQALLDICNESGGIIYLDPGEYLTSNTLIVGDNTHIKGAGASTKFIDRLANSKAGVTFYAVGSNVTIEGISGEYPGFDNPYKVGVANRGFIGVSAFNYAECKLALRDRSISWPVTPKNVHDVTIKNITSYDHYPIQTEVNGADANTPSGYLDGLTYENIKAPNGVVSVHANGDNAISNCNVSNVACAFFRARSGFLGGFNISNITCMSLDVSQRECSLENIYLDYAPGNIIERWYNEEPTWAAVRQALANIQQANVNNLYINAHDHDIVALAVRTIINNEEKISRVSNAIVKGVRSSDKAAVVIAGNATYNHSRFVNCDFSQNESLPNTLSGQFVNCELGEVNTQNSFIFSDSFARGIGHAFNTEVTRNISAKFNPNTLSNVSRGMVNLIGGYATIEGSYFPNSQLKIGSLNLGIPSKRKYIVATAFGTTGAHPSSPCIISVDTDGSIYLESIAQFYSNYFDRIFINGTYNYLA